MKKNKILWIIAAVIMVITSLLVVFSHYLIKNGTSIDVLVYTMAAGTDGTNPGVIWDGFKWIFPRWLLQCGIIALIVGAFHAAMSRLNINLTFIRKKANKTHVFCLNRLISILLLVGLLAVYPFGGFRYMDKQFKLTKYLKSINQNTDIYENYFADPASAVLTAPESKKNLIFIWLESMETTYADSENGGKQPVSCIPKLTQLAQSNLCFAGKDNPLSGMQSIVHAQFTFGALFSASCGAPYAFTIKHNVVTSRTLAPNEPFLWDVLNRDGYYNEYILGSDSAFAGTDSFVLSHGFDRILDLNGMIEEGYLPEGYYVNWGAEDKKVFEIAKDRLSKISQNGEPFTLMLSTMDTHFPVGYVCEDCPTEYSCDTANVVACTDSKCAAFIEWCAQQPFYEDTVIVIVGDHPRMDEYLVKDVPVEERTLYNCFINAVPNAENTENRLYCMMDLYPTVLAALGYEIQGDRIGFGTNLFSKEQTIMEQLGMDYFTNELSKHSDYFLEHFG